jgi:hypothetical protein
VSHASIDPAAARTGTHASVNSVEELGGLVAQTRENRNVDWGAHSSRKQLLSNLNDTIIGILSSCPEGLSSAEIAKRLGTTKNVSSNLSKLAAYGMINRLWVRPLPNARPTAIYVQRRESTEALWNTAPRAHAEGPATAALGQPTSRKLTAS